MFWQTKSVFQENPLLQKACIDFSRTLFIFARFSGASFHLRQRDRYSGLIIRIKNDFTFTEKEAEYFAIAFESLITSPFKNVPGGVTELSTVLFFIYSEKIHEFLPFVRLRICLFGRFCMRPLQNGRSSE